MTFASTKKAILAKPDKSNAGGIDKAIKPLVDAINAKKQYYTTSSCAGRILLLKQEGKEGKRRESRHFFVSHDPITLQELRKALQHPPQEEIVFHMEGMILHVCCDSLEVAERLLNLAKDAGFKRAGITSLRNKIMLEIIDTQRLDLPIARGGQVLVTDDYLGYLVEAAKEKLGLTRERMRRFLDGVKKEKD